MSDLQSRPIHEAVQGAVCRAPLNGRGNRTLWAMLAAGLILGCSKATELDPDQVIPDAPQVVEAYGLRLDAQASPEQVAWVLFKALEQDLHAPAQSPLRTEALRLQCQLFSSDLLADSRILKEQRGISPKDLYFERAIRYWAPALGRYIKYLPMDFETLRAGFTRKPGIGNDGREILNLRYALHGADHGGPPDLDLGVTIRIRLGKTREGYWRVDGVGFERSPDLPIRSQAS